MNKTTFRIVDFETTGFPDEPDHKHSVIESASIDIVLDENNGTDHYEEHVSLIIPSTDFMDIRSQALHNITMEEATEYGGDWDYEVNRLTKDDVIYVAHNASFEQNFFNPKDSVWIDTYKVAMYLYPDAPAHKLNVIKYYLGLKHKSGYTPEHRALPDCRVSVAVLTRMLEDATVQEMIDISKEPLYITKMSFGKHRGTKFCDLPEDYMRWLLKQTDMDESIEYAVLRELDRRGKL